MDRICEMILERVKEHNEKGEKIYWKKLTEILERISSKPTIHKKVRQLVEDGELIECPVTSDHGIFKYLYIPGMEEKSDPDAKLNRILMKLEEILRIMRDGSV